MITIKVSHLQGHLGKVEDKRSRREAAVYICQTEPAHGSQTRATQRVQEQLAAC